MDPDLFFFSDKIKYADFLSRIQVQQDESLLTTLVFRKDTPKNAELHPHVAMLFFRPIPLNRSGKKLLETLPNIGPVLAARIVKKRESMGGFGRLEDILLVKGIGKKKYHKIRNLISL